MTAEVRITNEITGGQKGRKAQRFELLPWAELADVAELYAFGATKYDDHNWRKGFAWSLSYGAMLRHATQFWNGEDTDDETQCSHLASVVFHALALMYFAKHHPQLDDRYVARGMKNPEVEGLKNLVESFQSYTNPDWQSPYDTIPHGLYIAGPMTGIRKFNFPAFDRVARALRSFGFDVTTPSELDDEETRAAALASEDGAPGSGTANGETWGDFLARDVKMLADDPNIQGIVLLPGWLDSRGARLEVFCGVTLCGKRAFEWDGSFIGREITDQVLTMMAEHGEPHLVPEAGRRVEDGRATAVAA